MLPIENACCNGSGHPGCCRLAAEPTHRATATAGDSLRTLHIRQKVIVVLEATTATTVMNRQQQQKGEGEKKWVIMKRNKKRIWKSERDWGWPEYPVCQCTRPTFKKWRLFKMASFSLIYLLFFSFLFFSFFVVVVAVVVVSTSSSSWSSFSSSATPLKWRRQRRLMSSDHICHVDTFPFIRFDSSFYHLIYIYIYIYIYIGFILFHIDKFSLFFFLEYYCYFVWNGCSVWL